MNRPFVITIDGTAGSGKGTLARALAAHYGFDYLDTGKIYRAVGSAVLRAGGNPHSEKDALAAAQDVAAHLTPQLLADPELRRDDVGQAASIVAVMSSVRTVLLEGQRQFIRHAARGAVMDGRDCGTVICPEAPVKFFVTASAEVRAHRRLKELSELNIAARYEDVLADIIARDTRDSERAAAPLKPAPDAIIMDTSAQSAEEVLRTAITRIDSVLSRP
jgi:cytidylate kinase